MNDRDDENKVKTLNAVQRGRIGERIALQFLKNKGYTIIATGFRTRFGEIDIIAENTGFLTFTEVKMRKNHNFAYAREHVNKPKQKKITATANIWLMKNHTALQPRFDVIEIYTERKEIIHIKNAFNV